MRNFFIGNGKRALNIEPIYTSFFSAFWKGEILDWISQYMSFFGASELFGWEKIHFIWYQKWWKARLWRAHFIRSIRLALHTKKELRRPENLQVKRNKMLANIIIIACFVVFFSFWFIRCWFIRFVAEDKKWHFLFGKCSKR